ncbi:MAG: hypothetical protein AAF355_01325 [Myxococcota bacterium]
MTSSSRPSIRPATYPRTPAAVRAHPLSLCALAAFAILSGCTRSASTAIRHPMQVGQIEPHQVINPHPSEEQSYLLPAGTLNNSAQLVQLDDQNVCIDLRLQRIDDGNGQMWTPLENWDIELETAEGQRIRQGVAQSMQPASQQFQGRTPQRVVVGEQEECVRQNKSGRCTRWERRPITEVRWLPGIVTVTSGGGNICFTHGGAVSLKTTGIKLKLERPAIRLFFEWLFTAV